MEITMKQGRASSNVREGKREPISKAVHETAAAELGRAVQYEKKDLYGGKGFKASGPSPAAARPGGGRTIHRSGTQGKHK
jgi:hypothetical protein